MPTLNAPGCRWPGCPQRAVVGRRHCGGHDRQRWRELDRERGNSAERGYDQAWRDFRRWFLSRHPLCADCRAEGTLKMAEEVHHTVKIAVQPELRLVESNCVALCVSCHATRTRRGE